MSVAAVLGQVERDQVFTVQLAAIDALLAGTNIHVLVLEVQ